MSTSNLQILRSQEGGGKNHKTRFFAIKSPQISSINRISANIQHYFAIFFSVTRHTSPLGGCRSTPPARAPQHPEERGPLRGPLGFAQPPGFAGARGAAAPHPVGARVGAPAGPPPLGSAPPPQPERPGSATLPRGKSGTSGPRRPPLGRLARLRWRRAPGPPGLRLAAPPPPLAALRRARWLGLSPPGPCASLRRALPPGAAACGRRLAPGSATCGRLRSGALCGWRLAQPCGALRPPVGRPWPSPGRALRARRRPGSPLARPGLRPGSSPCGARPGLVAPRGRRGPPGRFWRLPPPPGLRERRIPPPAGGGCC